MKEILWAGLLPCDALQKRVVEINKPRPVDFYHAMVCWSQHRAPMNRRTLIFQPEVCYRQIPIILKMRSAETTVELLRQNLVCSTCSLWDPHAPSQRKPRLQFYHYFLLVWFSSVVAQADTHWSVCRPCVVPGKHKPLPPNSAATASLQGSCHCWP